MRLLTLIEAGHRFHDLQVPQGDQMKAWLEQTFGDEANYGGEPGDGNYASTLGGGGDWAICTTWAYMVRDALPDRTKLYGFYIGDNPSAHHIADICDGHDFAVVDDRFIVDGWAKNVEGIANQSVFDLKDPADAKIILGLYGNPKSWTPG